MKYASLALRTLSRLDLMSSRGRSRVSEALWSSERKCSDTVVGSELFVCLSTGLRCSLKRSLMFVKTVFKSSFSFSNVLFVAAVAVYPVNNDFRVTV